MTEHKYTDEEIIRALECCRTIDGNDCSNCPYYGKRYEIGSGGCSNHLVNDALDLINRQKEEIERMKAGKACSIGDKLYIIVPGDGKDGGDGIEINRVTEVGERFIFFSGFAPPRDDILNNVEIADLGKEVFLDEAAFKQELERRRLEYDRGRGAGGV